MLTIERANELFEYREGSLIRRVTASATAVKGSIAGNEKPDGYVIVKVDKIAYGAHKIIFLMFNGFLPKMVDHINRIRNDNRIENLRECTNAQNQWNITARHNSKTGIKGVTWHSPSGKWQAQVQANGKRHFLGKFSDIKDAEKATLKAGKELHKEFNCRG